MKARAALSLALTLFVAACGGNVPPPEAGAAPRLPEPRSDLLPTLKIAKPAEWESRQPIVPEGYRIQLIAADLQIPRQVLVMPNGDILVSEGKGGGAPKLTPKDVIAGFIKAKGTSPVKGGDRLTLLRDANGDGEYEMHTVFAEDLNAPYGLALTPAASTSRTRTRWCVSTTAMG